MSNLANEVTLIGRVGSLKETTITTKEGIQSAVLAVNIVTEEGYFNKETGEFVERPVWHRGVIFGQYAKKIVENNSIAIGNKYIFRGHIAYSKSEGKDDNDNKVVYKNASIVIERIKFLSKSKGKDDTETSSSAKEPEQIPSDIVFDDEIPF